jgi:hypothetical protein
MFKYVETMRKVAFRIYSKTYGGRSKETNEPIYDAYPLKTLARVLCFETLDEARHACKHYNITVKEREVDVSSGVRLEEIVHWRCTSFKESKDPRKGTIIPLKPRKMVRIIEGKLRGATRLAVCRGEVSGLGSFISGEPAPSSVQVDSSKHQMKPGTFLTAEQDRSEMEDTKRTEDDDVRIRLQKEELERKLKQREEERKQLLFIKQREKEEAFQQQLANEEKARVQRRLQMEEEAANQREEASRRQAEEAAKKKAEEEARRLRAEAVARERAGEEAKRKEAEKKRLEALREQERLAQLERERQRLNEEKRVREEDERRRQEELEAKRLRIEMERKRQEEERKKRKAEREQHAVRLYLQWKGRADAARREVVWRRWLQKLPRQLSLLEQTHQSLSRISPTRTGRISAAPFRPHMEKSIGTQPLRLEGIRQVLESLLSQRGCLPVTSLLTAVAGRFSSESGDVSCSSEVDGLRGKTTLLFKVAVIFPTSQLTRDQDLCKLLRLWVDSRLRFGNVFSAQVESFDVRVVFVDGRSVESRSDCDAAMVALPPPWSNDGKASCGSDIESLADLVPTGVPLYALLLSENAASDSQGMDSVTSAFGGHSGSIYIKSVQEMRNDAVELGLRTCVQTIFENFLVEAAPRVERVSVFFMCFLCINNVIWLGSSVESRDDVIQSARIVLRYLLDEIDSNLDTAECSWPTSEFASQNEVVHDYFQQGHHLPIDWPFSLRIEKVGARMKEVARTFDGTLSLPEVVAKLLFQAPALIQEECAAMLDQRSFRRCLQTAIQWQANNDDNAVKGIEDIVYLPYGLLEEMVQNATARFKDYLLVNGDDNKKGINDITRRIGSEAFRPRKETKLLEAEEKPKASESKLYRPREVESEFSPIRKRLRHAGTPDAYTSQSNEFAESVAFTKKLQAMLRGSLARDMIVGHTTLSALLSEAPNLAGEDR